MTEAGFDTSRLRELAKAATPGPWRISESDDGTVKGPTPTGWLSSSQIPDDAAYIAALYPAVVLSLLDRIEELEASLGKLRAEHLGCEPTKEKATAPPGMEGMAR